MKHITIASALIGLIMIGCGESASSSSDGGSSASGGGTGVGGSMARFAISGDLLYTVNSRSLQAFDISQPADPIIYERAYDVPFDVETLYSYKDRLYIGSKTGLYVYSKPSATKDLDKIGEFGHIRSNDPVVVQDDIAYVTLNSRRGDGANELQILDVTKPSPTLIKRQRAYLLSPGGLGIDGKTLFICDGKEGLKLFDVNRTINPDNNESNVTLTFNRASSLPSLQCYDLIPHKGLLLVSHEASVSQFDYTHLPMVEYKK